MPQKVETVCDWCGVNFTKLAIEMHPRNFCCREHFRLWNRARVSEYNRVENRKNRPEGWTQEEKERARDERLGEVVHHIDGDITNNSPGNLRVMTQSEHARLHAMERRAARGGDA